MRTQFVFIESFLDFVQEERRMHQTIEKSCRGRLGCEYRAVVGIETRMKALIESVCQKVLEIRDLGPLDIFDDWANVLALLRIKPPAHVSFFEQLQFASDIFNQRIKDCIYPSLHAIRAR